MSRHVPPRTARRARTVPLAMLLIGIMTASCTSGARRSSAEGDPQANSTPGATATGSTTGTTSAAGGTGTMTATDTASQSPSAASSAVAPTLSRLTPDTIRLGRGEAPTLTLTGSGFVAGHTGGSGGFAVGGNAIHVGRATFDMIPADSAGRSIRFAMPLTYTDTAARGRPSSFAPGTFSVSVTTPNGTSNALSLVMIP
ncbi:MAG: hypothetical protein U0164_12450 [Gemmatimonadaceae bacterium]